MNLLLSLRRRPRLLGFLLLSALFAVIAFKMMPAVQQTKGPTPSGEVSPTRSAGRAYCYLNNQPYSEGAIVRTPNRYQRCTDGKWVALEQR